MQFMEGTIAIGEGGNVVAMPQLFDFQQEHSYNYNYNICSCQNGALSDPW